MFERHFTEKAVKQIVAQFKLDPEIFLREQIFAVLCEIDDYRRAADDLQAALNYQDFEWPVLDKSIKMCLKNEVYPETYSFLHQPMTPIETVADLLPRYTVAQLKTFIQEKSLPVKRTGKKADLIAAIAAHTTLADFELEISLLEAEDADQSPSLQEKCFLIVSAVYSRASHLRQRNNCLANEQDGVLFWKEKLYFHDKQMAEVLLGINGYPQPNPQTGKFNRLPPYFIGDHSHIITEIDRDRWRNKPQTNATDLSPPTVLQTRQNITPLSKPLPVKLPDSSNIRTERTRPNHNKHTQEKQPSGCLARIMLFFALLWLALGCLALREAPGLRKLMVLAVFSLPFGAYWLWRQKRNQPARLKRHKKRR